MTINEIINLTRRYTNTTVAEYPNSDIFASLTAGAHFLMSEVFDSMDDWDIKGEIATSSLISGQNEYVFPTDIAKIKRIEVSYDGINWHNVDFVDINQGRNSNSESRDFSNPFAEIFDNSIFLKPTPETTILMGLRIWYSKESVGESATGSDISAFSLVSDVPIIRPAFRKALAYIASIDYFTQFKEWTSVNVMENKLEKVVARMRIFYGNRISDRQVIVQGVSSLENYE